MASTRELFILGLIAKGPTYGYEIKQFLSDAVVENWTNISITHIYHTLGKLKQEGLVEARSERFGLQPPRDIYSITPKGEEALTQMLKQDQLLDQQTYFDFNVVLAAVGGMKKMTDDEKTLVVKRRIQIVENKIRQCQERRSRGIKSKFDDTPLVQALSRHDRGFLEFELKWLQEVLEEVERLGWKAFAAGSHKSRVKQESLIKTGAV